LSAPIPNTTKAGPVGLSAVLFIISLLKSCGGPKAPVGGRLDVY
jgi:hypothetical protein